jgi:hypothetical protein
MTELPGAINGLHPVFFPGRQRRSMFIVLSIFFWLVLGLLSAVIVVRYVFV